MLGDVIAPDTPISARSSKSAGLTLSRVLRVARQAAARDRDYG
jgi:hypothetical protein